MANSIHPDLTVEVPLEKVVDVYLGQIRKKVDLAIGCLLAGEYEHALSVLKLMGYNRDNFDTIRELSSKNRLTLGDIREIFSGNKPKCKPRRTRRRKVLTRFERVLRGT